MLLGCISIDIINTVDPVRSNKIKNWQPYNKCQRLLTTEPAFDSTQPSPWFCADVLYVCSFYICKLNATRCHKQTDRQFGSQVYFWRYIKRNKFHFGPHAERLSKDSRDDSSDDSREPPWCGACQTAVHHDAQTRVYYVHGSRKVPALSRTLNNVPQANATAHKCHTYTQCNELELNRSFRSTLR